MNVGLHSLIHTVFVIVVFFTIRHLESRLFHPFIKASEICSCRPGLARKLRRSSCMQTFMSNWTSPAESLKRIQITQTRACVFESVFQQ